MALVELWHGRAGTGKSTCVATEIAKRVGDNPLGGKIYWVVPETASFAAERLLMTHVRSTIRAEVITLARLAERLEQQLPGEKVPNVNATGRRLLLADVIHHAGGALDVLHRAKPTMSLLDSILATFDEMAEHLVSMDGLEAALQVASARVGSLIKPVDVLAGHRLLGKLHDLCILYARYQSALRERGLADPAERVLRIAPHVQTLPVLQGSEVYFDGFRDLTLRELQFAMGLATASDRAVFVVSADASWFKGITAAPGQALGSASASGTDAPLAGEASPFGANLLELMEATGRPGDVFAPEAVRYVRNVVEGCITNDIPLKRRQFPETGALATTGFQPMLRRLEENIIKETNDTEFALVDVVSDPCAIQLVAAQNVRAEVDGVARDILQRVHKGTCRFRDIVVVVPSVADYAAWLRVGFARYQIPIDIADAPALTTYPLAKFLLGALLAVDDNLSTDSVIRLLKTEFCGLGRDDADWLESYLVRHAVEGPAMWDVEWTFSVRRTERSEDRIAVAEDRRANQLRQVLAPMLHSLLSQLRHAKRTPSQVADALWMLLESVNARRRVATWLVDESATANPHEAAVHEQAWQRLMDILTDLRTTLPDAVLPRRFIFQSIRTDMAAQMLAGVPTGLDAVLVLDIERAAAVHASVAYLVGVTDGALPRRIRSTGLLQDDERAQFLQLFGQRLGDSAEEQQVAERWRVYTAVTRATRCLVITYPLAGADGKELRPSSLIGQIRACFPVDSLPELWWREEGVESAEHTVWTPNTGLQWLLASLREYRQGSRLRPGTTAMFRWLRQHPVYGIALARSLGGLSHAAVAERLTRGTAAALYGHPLRMNAYQLETAAACPYKHFAQYGLHLHESERGDITAAQRGTLIHAALAEFVLQHRSRPDEWRQLSDTQAAEHMSAVVSSLLETPAFDIWRRTATRQQQAAEAAFVARRAAVVLTRHARHSQFVPERLELAFGMESPGALPAYKVVLADGSDVELRGRIDRVDFAHSEELSPAEQTPMFRIVDYKSRVMKLDLNRLYYGLSLQLAVYSQVVRHYSRELFGQWATPAGVFYQPLVRRFETKDEPIADTVAFEQALTRMKVHGLWLGDDTAMAWMDKRLAAGEPSELFPKMFKKDGSFMKNAPVLEPDDWMRMEEAVQQRVRELAETVRGGDIRIAPYAFDRHDQACNNCVFAAVCQIDKRWDPRPLRWLPKLARDEVLMRWREEEVQ